MKVMLSLMLACMAAVAHSQMTHHNQDGDMDVLNQVIMDISSRQMAMLSKLEEMTRVLGDTVKAG